MVTYGGMSKQPIQVTLTSFVMKKKMEIEIYDVR